MVRKQRTGEHNLQNQNQIGREETETSSLLPPLHDGHAPIYLHHAFHEAVDACEDWPLDSAEPVVQVNGKITRISVVFRRLWNCTDTVPRDTLEALKEIVPSTLVRSERWRDNSTFAEAARVMRSVLEMRKARALPAYY
ncbi:hypothetical protein C010_03022 [Brucella ovis 80/125]|uniref:Uncharacterized protein n=1 Tax=Brucella ovis (strain ATCC 25840 / 63/290 / NCTC 10512) TaxID=444178 RepID=A0A0H3AST1_BRUO2|nr:conserved hypothetical protein [Brucella ovis ATCC 25840]ENQ99422.1 hypothetical protein C010_03022 [Brucella ovis 80/125]ENS92403.1 hypothetical protein B999_02990 [Brucella ovis 63/96]SUW68395.1 Uncharacterised protein [Brucella ovis]